MQDNTNEINNDSFLPQFVVHHDNDELLRFVQKLGLVAFDLYFARLLVSQGNNEFRRHLGQVFLQSEQLVER